MDYELEVTDKAIEKISGIIENDDDYSPDTTLFRILVTSGCWKLLITVLFGEITATFSSVMIFEYVFLTTIECQ